MTLKEAVEINKADPDYHFFDDNEMKVWSTELHGDLYMDRYFITSEDNFDNTKRLFSVREFNEDYTKVNTIGFQKWDSFEEAKAFVLENLTP